MADPDTPESRPDDAPGADLHAADTPETMTPADRSAETPAGEHPDPRSDDRPDPGPEPDPDSDADADPDDGAGDRHSETPDADTPDDQAEPLSVDPSDEDTVDRQPAAPRPPRADPARPDRRAELVRTGPERGEPVRAGSLLVAAAMTGGWAAVVSFAPVLIVVLLGWFGSGAGSGGAAVRFALTGWLLGHGVPFTAAGREIGLVPLGLTALIVWRLVRAGAHTARAVAGTPRDTPYVVLALAGAYGVLGGVAALFASTPDFTVSPLRALLTTAVVGGLASAPGAAVESGAVRRLGERLPEPVRDGLRGGVVAALGVLAAGAALAGAATAVAYPDAVDLYRGYQVGVAGGAGITLVGLLYAPNLTVWGASYLIGPGFAFGTGTEVTVFDVSLGPLPAVPVLAGLPTGPAPTGIAVLLAVPVAVGMLVAVATVRRAPEREWALLLGAAALTGPVAGAVLGAASFAASGPLGSARLAEIGPVWWSVALVTTVLVGVGAVVAATAARLSSASP